MTWKENVSPISIANPGNKNGRKHMGPSHEMKTNTSFDDAKIAVVAMTSGS